MSKAGWIISVIGAAILGGYPVLGVAATEPVAPTAPVSTAAPRYTFSWQLGQPDAPEYYQKTRAFWDGVLKTWHQLFVAHPQITLRAPVDQAGLFHKLFEYAVIRESLLDMGAPVPAQRPVTAWPNRQR